MMNKGLNIYCVLGVIFFHGLCVTTILAQHKQEVVVTIEGSSAGDKLVHFQRAEELRKQMKFTEAIEEYRQVIAPGEISGKEAEAHYDIGICYTWLGKKDEAESVFQEVLNTYSDDGEVMAYTKYCLSWIDVQRRNFQAAVDRLQLMLDEKMCSDVEFCARTQFQIGRIYLVYMHDHEKAERIFWKVLEEYPTAKITNHPFLRDLQNAE